jgi:hypothetical protein
VQPTQTIALHFSPGRDPLAWFRLAWRRNRPLTFAGALMVLTLAATLVGLVVDPRVIIGAPAWLKPAKFSVSIAIYCFTLLWLLGFVQGHRRLVGLVAWGTAGGLLLEQVLIVLQVVRGTTSHFNVATPFDAAVWGAMGSTIVLVWFLTLLTAILLIRQRLPNPAFAWALRLGVLVSLVGMTIAFFMTQPTPAQEAQAAAGGGMPIAGGHSVGVPDGGSGLPIVGWSTVGGDLRAAHFVGLHALQVLPLLGWLLSRTNLDARRQVALVWTAGVAYLGLVLLLTWQALRGQSIIAPDGLTLGAFAALVAVAGAASLAVVATRWRPAAG